MHREGDNSSSELRVHFVEDRYETLLGIAENRKLDHVALYLVGK